MRVTVDASAEIPDLEEKLKRSDRVYKKIDELFNEAAITDNEWRWARATLPEFFKRISELEQTTSCHMPMDKFWGDVERWGKNHLHLFDQVKLKRASIEGIPETSEADVERAVAEYNARPPAEPKPGSAPAKRKRRGKRDDDEGLPDN